MNWKILGARVPEPIIGLFQDNVRYAGKEENVRAFVGKIIAISFLAGLVFAGAFGLYTSAWTMTLLGLGIGFFGMMGFQLYALDSAAIQRSQSAEIILPDALQLIASNIKSGMTTEKALFASARDEFGVLAEELKNAGRKILTGEKTTRALMDISNNIKSKPLQRTLSLLTQGIQSGGQIADLLLELGSELREEQALQKETQANISMYLSTIFLTAAIGAPVLFGISSIIIGISSEQLGNIQFSTTVPGSGQSVVGVGSLITGDREIVSPEFIQLFVFIVIAVTSLSASFTMGVIQHGSEKYGLKTVPVILVIALIVFFSVTLVLGQIIKSAGFGLG